MADTPQTSTDAPQDAAIQTWRPEPAAKAENAVREIGGRKDGTDPTRYGDWEKNGRCIDF